MSYGNGGYNPIPSGLENIWSTSVPNGTYGSVTPMFGSFGNSNSTPQMSGVTIIKGDGYVKYVEANGNWSSVNSNGLVNSGCGHW